MHEDVCYRKQWGEFVGSQIAKLGDVLPGKRSEHLCQPGRIDAGADEPAWTALRIDQVNSFQEGANVCDVCEGGSAVVNDQLFVWAEAQTVEMWLRFAAWF